MLTIDKAAFFIQSVCKYLPSTGEINTFFKKAFSWYSSVLGKCKSRSTRATQRPFTKHNRYLRFPSRSPQADFSSFSPLRQITRKFGLIGTTAETASFASVHNFSTFKFISIKLRNCQVSPLCRARIYFTAKGVKVFFFIFIIS